MAPTEQMVQASREDSEASLRHDYIIFTNDMEWLLASAEAPVHDRVALPARIL